MTRKETFKISLHRYVHKVVLGVPSREKTYKLREKKKGLRPKSRKYVVHNLTWNFALLVLISSLVLRTAKKASKNNLSRFLNRCK